MLLVIVLFSCTKTSHPKNAIDRLNSNKAVDSFVHKQYGDRFKDYFLDTSFFADDSFLLKMLPGAKPKPWAKADFDGNGLTDILIIQRRGNNWNDGRNIICLMDSGENRVIKKSLSAGILSEPGLAEVKIINNIPMIIFYKLSNDAPSGITNVMVQNLQTDTLFFMFDDFISYNRHPSAKNNIDSISLETSGCFGACPIFELTVSNNGNATYLALNYNKDSSGGSVNGGFKTIINKEDIESLFRILNYTDFSRIRNDYHVSWSDDETATLTIKFANGIIKKITDYGMQGTFNLEKYTRNFLL